MQLNQQMTPKEITDTLKETVSNFGDTCYSGPDDNQCHYPKPFGEIHVLNIKVC